MRVENIVRRLPCSPLEFIEIYKEGKVLLGHEHEAGKVAKQLEAWKESKIGGTGRAIGEGGREGGGGGGGGKGEQVIKFVSAAHAPDQLLKMIGRSNATLKEQQELTITEGGIKIHTFYLPDMIPDNFRVETFWNITTEKEERSEEVCEGNSIVDISIRSESGSYTMGQLLETFVAQSVAASILQYLDIVDSYITKFRAKMKQILGPFVPSSSLFGFGGGRAEEDEEVEASNQEEQMRVLIAEFKKVKGELFRESQRLLRMEIDLAEKRPHSSPSHSPSHSSSSLVVRPRSLTQVTCELWRAGISPPLPPLSSPAHVEEQLAACEAGLRALSAMRRRTEHRVEARIAACERRDSQGDAQGAAQRDSRAQGGAQREARAQGDAHGEAQGLCAQVMQCAKYAIPISGAILVVLAVLQRRKVL